MFVAKGMGRQAMVRESSSKIGLIVAGVIIAVLAGGAFLVARRGNQTKPQTSTTEDSSEISNQEHLYTREEVAKHMDASSCWTIIEEMVYDVTRYIPNHPGGSEILRACGKDGTTLFTTRHTESGERVGSGSAHSSSAETTLATFKIGELAD
jgi:hypothetical protein